MNTPQFQYRIRQFKLARNGSPTTSQLKEVEEILNEKQLVLFKQMQPAEQLHAILVYQQLVRQGYSHPHLLVASLLHDVGKIRYPLKNYQRVIIVIARKMLPSLFKISRNSSAIGWKKPFVVANKHANWGAEMAAHCDTDKLAVTLIRRHQTKNEGKVIKLEDQLLLALQQADNQN